MPLLCILCSVVIKTQIRVHWIWVAILDFLLSDCDFAQDTQLTCLCAFICQNWDTKAFCRWLWWGLSELTIWHHLAQRRCMEDICFLFLCPSARFTKMSRWWWLRINTPRLVTTGWSYHGPPFPVWRLWPGNNLSSSNTCMQWGKRWLQMLLSPANSAFDWATMPFPAWGKPCG